MSVENEVLHGHMELLFNVNHEKLYETHSQNFELLTDLNLFTQVFILKEDG